MDKEEILQTIFSVLGKKDILLAVLYGRRNGNDIDVFVVVNQNFQYQRYDLGKIEVTAVGIPNVIYLLKGFDPIVTEPILTGEALYEDALKRSKMEEYLLNRKADQATIMHLTKAARKTWHWAKICYQENDHRHALVNLTFSLSYLAFARYYKKAPKVITFYKLLEEHSDSLLRKTYRLSKSPDPIKLGELERFLSQQEERI